MVELKDIIKEIKKQTKFLSVKGGEDIVDPTEFVSTGSLPLDWCLDGKGFSFRFIVQLLGKSKSGKTALMKKVVGNAQKKYNAYALWVDREGAFIRNFAEKLGVDMSKVIVLGPVDCPIPKNAFGFLAAAHEAIRSKDPESYIVMCLDSIAAFLPSEDLDAGEDMGKVAKGLHRGFRSIVPIMDDKTMFIFSNQIQSVIGILFGKKETAAGGNAPEYYSHYILELDQGKLIKDENNITTGQYIEAEVVKTRLGPAHRGCIIPFNYNTGFSEFGGFMRMLVAQDILIPTNKQDFKRGVSTRYRHIETDKIYQEDEIEVLLKDHPDILENKDKYVIQSEEEE